MEPAINKNPILIGIVISLAMWGCIALVILRWVGVL